MNITSEESPLLSAIKSQQIASNPSFSVFVSASAGTGKTKILCDRFIRIMLSGSLASSIFCVTFTNAAASEMEERIRQKLINWSIISDEALLKELSGLMDTPNIEKARALAGQFTKELNSLKIQTLHSFCSNLLNLHYNKTLPQGLKLLSPIEGADLLNKAFLKAIEEQRESFFNLAEYAEVATIFDDVRSILSKRYKIENFLNAHNDLENVYNAIFSITSDKVDILDEFWQKNINALLQLQAIFQQEQHAKHKTLTFAVQSRDFSKLSSVFLTSAGTLHSRLFKKEALDRVFNLANLIEKIGEEISSITDQIKAHTNARSNYDILKLAKSTLQFFKTLKLEMGAYDYDDLLINAHTLLTNSQDILAILHDLDYKIDHILVDEAQDLSALQWDIIRTIADEFFKAKSAESNDRTVFIVGDFKQSIYSFQGANPEIFSKMREHFKALVQAADKQWRDVELSVSFRTTAPVLNAVDKFFNINNLQKQVGSENNLQHIPFKKGDGFVEVIPLIETPKDDKQDSWIMPSKEEVITDNKQLLAEQLAHKIKVWLTQKRKLFCKNKVIEPGDILILVRKRSEFTKMLAVEFFKNQIPFVNQDKLLLNNELIVQDIMSLLKFVCNANDDLNLAGLLKSPFFEISEELLFELCTQREKASLYSLIVQRQLFSELMLYRSLYARYSLEKFVYRVLEILNKRSLFITRFGSRANIVIDAFLQKVSEYSQQHPANSILEFINWFERNNIEAIPVTSNSNAVRIMTCHASKGLQAPIVIIADSASSEQSPSDKLNWLGDIPLYSVSAPMDCEVITNVKEQMKEQQKAEGYRLLYVAMTRAEEELYISGWDNNRIKNSWFSQLKNSEIEFKDIAMLYDESASSCESIPATPQNSAEFIRASDRVLIASKAVDRKTKEMEYGEIMHLLMQLSLVYGKELTQQKLPIIANKYRKHFKPDEINKCYNQASIIYAKFKDRLEGGYSEAAVYGYIDGEKVSVRIDWLKIDGNNIDIYDFKTDAMNDDIKPDYIRQLAIYKRLIAQKYPHSNIKTYLLWLNHAQLSEVSN